MPETFPDGFPISPVEAIEFSYFFTDAEKQDWREWVKTASAEEQSEMVETLHGIWLDKQAQVIPQQFNGGSFAQDPQIIQQQPQSIAQEISSPTLPQVSPQTDAIQAPDEADDKDEFDFNFDFDDDEDDQEQPLVNLDNDKREEENLIQDQPNLEQVDQIIEQENTDSQVQNIPDQSLNKIADKTINVTQNSAPTQTKIELNQALDTLDDGMDNLDFLNEIKNAEQPVTTQPTPTPIQTNNSSFSISKIRESGTRNELETLYNRYLDARSSVSSTKQDHDQSYDQLMDKVISIVLNFEGVADHLEFMTDKLSQMNSTIIKQAEEILSFKNGQNNYASDLSNQLASLESRVTLLENKLSNDLDTYRNRLDGFEVKFSGQSDSAYTGYDDLNTQIDLLKSKLIKLEQKDSLSVSNSSNPTPASSLEFLKRDSAKQ